ncbi:MAG: hypothetical protein K8S20_14390 [Chloroflexi bacterium]|nr:hypothetical protein [Chloroflexota bacterium]
MKIPTQFLLFVFFISACGPLVPLTPESALTPGTYEYQDFAYSMTFSRDDRLLAVTTLTGMYIYDVKTLQQLAAFDEPRGSTSTFGGRYLAAITANGLFAWDLKDYKLLFKLESAEPASFQSLAISPDDTLLAAAEKDRLRLWSLPEGKLLATIPGAGFLSDVAFKNNGRLVVADASLGVIQELDIHTQKKIRETNVGTPVIQFNLSDNGQTVVVDYGSSGFELWDVNTGRLKHVYRDVVGAPGWNNLSSDARSVVVWGYGLNTNDSGLSVWDLSVHNQLFESTTPIVNGDGWRCGALNSDGSVLAASNNEGFIYFYDIVSGEKTGEIFLPYKFIVEKG